MNLELPTIVLVGPTNVGKSTLFNRFTGSRAAIVADRPGVTVDRHELELKSSPVGPVRIVDTGGVGARAREHALGAEIEIAAAKAIESATIVGLVVDGTLEPGAEELEVAQWLRNIQGIDKKPVAVLVNKSDSKKFDVSPYYALGFEELFAVSAEHDKGLNDFWEWAEKQLSVDPELRGVSTPKQSDAPRIIVIGRPNVGKSTLLNSILGTERHVISEVPGTTRDTIESEYDHHGFKWQLVDTAGMRRPGRLERNVEWVAREKLKDQARRSQLAILLVDSTEGVTDLDAAIAGMAIDFGLSLIIAFNKWDKVTGEVAQDFLVNLTRTSDLKLGGMDWAPALRVSGLTGRGVSALLDKVQKLLKAREQRVPTARLNAIFEKKLKYHSHPLGPRGRVAKFYYLSQVGVNPPEFVVFTNIPSEHVHVSYRRFVVNSLRQEFGFEGTPLRVHFKKSRV